MDSLFKKLDELSDLLKKAQAQFNPSIKMPKPPKAGIVPKQPKIPGMTPSSKKDPAKVAQQLKNKELKPKTEMTSFNSGGQWSLNKQDLPKPKEDLYHIHVDGHVVTDKPMNLKELVSNHGPVKRIESQPGHKIVKIK